MHLFGADPLLPIAIDDTARKTLVRTLDMCRARGISLQVQACVFFIVEARVVSGVSTAGFVGESLTDRADVQSFEWHVPCPPSLRARLGKELQRNTA